MQPHKQFLLRCIELAKQRLGFCAPNPAVGCVIVKNNKIIAEGFHLGCGYAHAEVDALDKCADVSGATLYVSLEPCCHYGRTPPCTERIKKAGIHNVFFGLLDPNPMVAGKGRDELIRAGISCEQFELPEINLFYVPYIYWTKNKKPFVIAKLAISADNKIALKNGKSVKISGKECDTLTHQYRLESDAILTTINTVLNDDPQLNARINNSITAKNIYILDSDARLPLHATLFQTAQSITVFCSQKKEIKGARTIVVSKNEYGLNLQDVLTKIGEDGVHHLWVEVGARCFNSFLQKNLLNRIILYISKNKLGDEAMSSGINLNKLINNTGNVQKNIYGDDVVYTITGLDKEPRPYKS